jgi:hypothetical protein
MGKASPPSPESTVADETPGPAQADPTPVTTEPAEAKKADVPEWLSPESLAKYDKQTLKLINKMDGEIDSLYDDALSKKAAAKEAKDAWEAKRDELQRIIKERKAGRGKPVQKTLFETTPATDEPAPAEPLEVIPVATPSELDDLWKSFPLDRCETFGMTPRDIGILASGERKGGYAAYPVRTVGEMAEYTAGDGAHPRHVGDFRGLGASGETRIAAALEGFWGWWNKGGMAEYAKEKGLNSGGQDPQPDARGGRQDHGGGDLGDAVQPGGTGGPAGDDGEQVVSTTVTVEHLPNDPDAKPEEEATVPAGAGDTFTLGG